MERLQRVVDIEYIHSLQVEYFVNTISNLSVQYLVIAGGGGGGGFLTKACYPVTGGTDLTITVGGGGTAGAGNSCTGRGGDSSITGPGICNVTATGGGYGHRLAHGGPGGSAGVDTIVEQMVM